MKAPTPYKRIRAAQERAAKRLAEFKIREALMKRIVLALQEQDNASDIPRPPR